VLAQRLQHFVAPGRGRERRRAVEREQLEGIAVRAVPWRRIGRQPGGAERRVQADLQGRLVARGAGQGAFDQRAFAARQADHQRMHQRVRGGRVGVFHQQHQRAAVRRVGPHQRR